MTNAAPLRKILVRAAAAVLLAGMGASVVPGGVASGAPTRDAAIARARQHLANHPKAFRAGPQDAFVVKDAVLDADGTEHVRFDRTYKGLDVIGGDVVVHGKGNGRFASASVTVADELDLETTPQVTEEQAIAAATASFDGTPSASSSKRLAVWARAAEPVLVREVQVDGVASDGGPSELHVFVDAKTGAVIDSWDGIQHARRTTTTTVTAPQCATGVGLDDVGLYNQNVCLATTYNSSAKTYQLVDPDRAKHATYDYRNTTNLMYHVTDADNAWGGAADPAAARAAVDAHYGAAATWDYYQQTLGRNGIANDGRAAQSRVHYGVKYNNAFWSDSCFCMVYGDGDGSPTGFRPLVSLDIAGHEMTHGMTSRAAGLVYSGESGGLNESTSDVFGTAVEFSKGAGDYLIGEDVAGSEFGGALRFMHQPSLDKKSFDCYRSDIGTYDVHYSSGVGNRAFYLLAEGSAPTVFTGAQAPAPCDGVTTVAGIGRIDAAKIWYRALDIYWTSNTNYAGARAGMVQAATDLFGASSTQVSQVRAAWSAVGVG